jgi:cysteine desulfurase
MTLKLPIYLDHNATAPVDPSIVEAMLPFFSEEFGNPASGSHRFGWKAEQACEQAREQVASLIGASRREIIFTSGATESNNLALKGVAEMYAGQGRHIITSRSEHSAVLDPCEYLESRGYRVTYLAPDAKGLVSAEQVAEAIDEDTILVSIMLANNETGTLQPIADIGAATRQRGVLMHTDAVQAAGRVAIDVDTLNVDLLSLSGHKLYGPKGIGALYVRRREPRVRLSPQMHGGGHEGGLRSGTLNVPGIVGLGRACEIAAAAIPEEAQRQAALRDRLETRLAERIAYVKRNGHPSERLCNTSNLSFAYVEGEALMMKLKTIAVATGSACASGSGRASHVLQAMGVPESLAHASLRFSLGRRNTEAEIDYAVDCVVRAVSELREVSPLYESVQETGDDGSIEWFSGPEASAGRGEA